MTRFFEKSAEIGGQNYLVEVYYKSTQSGFYHRAYIYCCGKEIANYRKSYLNRTWERFAGESAIKAAIDRCPKEIQQSLKDAFVFKD